MPSAVWGFHTRAATVRALVRRAAPPEALGRESRLRTDPGGAAREFAEPDR